MKSKQDSDNRIGVIYAEYDIELSGQINSIRYMTNMRQDNDMINRLGPLYVKKKNELS